MLYGTFTKAIYIPLILLFLLVPNDRFKSNKQAVIVKIGVSLLCLLMLYTFIFPTVSSSDVAGDSRGGDTSVSEQLKLIINYPLDYLVVLKNTALSLFSARTFSKDIFGNYAYMGKISDNLYYLFFISLLFVAATDTQKEKLTKINKLLLLLLIIGIIILIWTALYLSYTPVGLNTINGVQARYFIPLLFPLIICFQSSKIKNNISDKVYNILVIAIPAFVLMVSLYNVILINYCI
jgi:uncharacterized membrane protein